MAKIPDTVADMNINFTSISITCHRPLRFIILVENVSSVIDNIIRGKIISDKMFVRCTKLKNLTLTKNVKEIVGGCFNYCESLNAITYESSLADWNAVKKNFNWNGHSGNIEISLTKPNISNIKIKYLLLNLEMILY